MFKLEFGDLVKISPSDLFSENIKKYPEIGLFLDLNENSWVGHPVANVYVKGIHTTYSVSLITKI